MKAQLFASLVDVIEAWLGDNVDDLNLWRGGVHLEEHIARAGAAVIDACIESTSLFLSNDAQ